MNKLLPLLLFIFALPMWGQQHEAAPNVQLADSCNHLLIKELGDKQMANQEYQQAIRSYENAIELQPNYTEAYIGMGDALVCRGNSDQQSGFFDFACAAYADAAKIAPNYALVYRKWGEALFAQAQINGDTYTLQKSCAKYQKALRLDSTDASTHFHWAQALSNHAFAEGDSLLFDQAYQKYQTATQLAPYNGTYYLHWAQSLCANGISVKKDSVLIMSSMSLYQMASVLMPSNNEVLKNWGIALVKLGAIVNRVQPFDQAIQLLQLATQGGSDNRIVFNYYLSAFVGIARLQKEKTNNELIALFESQLANNEYEYDSFTHAAAFYALIGQKIKALHYLKRDMEEASDHRFGCVAIHAVEKNEDYNSLRQEARYADIIKEYCYKNNK